jgi:hypothetical protein
MASNKIVNETVENHELYNMSEKTRDIPLYEYFSKLQEEYICAELRHKIYPKPKDKTYWKEKVMIGKKKKIEDIALRNCLKSIFTSDEIRDKYYNKVFNKIGYPNFVYKDEQERELLELSDLQNYYHNGSEVRIGDDGEMIGKVCDLDLNRLVATVFIDNKKEQYTLRNLTRIL